MLAHTWNLSLQEAEAGRQSSRLPWARVSAEAGRAPLNILSGPFTTDLRHVCSQGADTPAPISLSENTVCLNLPESGVEDRLGWSLLAGSSGFHHRQAEALPPGPAACFSSYRKEVTSCGLAFLE